MAGDRLNNALRGDFANVARLTEVHIPSRIHCEADGAHQRLIGRYVIGQQVGWRRKLDELVGTGSLRSERQTEERQNWTHQAIHSSFQRTGSGVLSNRLAILTSSCWKWAFQSVVL